MIRLLKLVLWLAVATGVAAGGYRLGAGNWPDMAAIRAIIEGKKPETTVAEPTAPSAAAGRRILYWKHPDGKPEYSPWAFKTKDGGDYAPVYADQELPLPARRGPKIRVG